MSGWVARFALWGFRGACWFFRECKETNRWTLRHSGSGSFTRVFWRMRNMGIRVSSLPNWAKLLQVINSRCTNFSNTEKSNENASYPSKMSFSWSLSWKIYSDRDWRCFPQSRRGHTKSLDFTSGSCVNTQGPYIDALSHALWGLCCEHTVYCRQCKRKAYSWSVSSLWSKLRSDLLHALANVPDPRKRWYT